MDRADVLAVLLQEILIAFMISPYAMKVFHHLIRTDSAIRSRLDEFFIECGLIFLPLQLLLTLRGELFDKTLRLPLRLRNVAEHLFEVEWHDGLLSGWGHTCFKAA